MVVLDEEHMSQSELVGIVRDVTAVTWGPLISGAYPSSGEPCSHALITNPIRLPMMIERGQKKRV